MRFHTHMLRDTYAVELLLAGVSLEDVSRLLTHSSIKTTEEYYGHWVPDRLAKLRVESCRGHEENGRHIQQQIEMPGREDRACVISWQPAGSGVGDLIAGERSYTCAPSSLFVVTTIKTIALILPKHEYILIE